MNPIERNRLGTTDVEVTRLGLGLAPLGGLYRAVGAAQASATLERAWELGFRYFDTAPLYGAGLSERRAGSVLAGKPRDEFTLSTKVGRLLVPGREAPRGGRHREPDPEPVDHNDEIWAEPVDLTPAWDFSADGTRRSYAESLDRLGLDRADVLHVHDPDDHYADALAGALPALVELRGQGRIGAVSVGMNQAEMLADFVRTGDVDAVLLAGRYTLLDQSGLAELLPLCARERVSVIAGGVYNSGLLADPKPGATYDYLPAPAELLDRARAIQDVCAKHGVPLRAAAIQFPLGHPAVASVVVGARSADEVTDAAEMFAHPIPGQLWRDLKDAGLLPEEVPTP
ncbi:D-threo-aldose 1-dehydrogenase [Micromonospora pisi]|uniref:D-threo-aldose 1-dehydrogenase n=1 Tax=Micromonospora pisi TaxID=589240 RepID=A0A495JQS8_9ACTN|nr:aldo/keto reductase [Micromonospora pisi]RKR91201.1 D-threo-aldose 1-dehydrogenase [Micromonospora pisi]